MIKDRINSVRNEDHLQSLLVTFTKLRHMRSSTGLKVGKKNNKEVARKAVRAVLGLDDE